MPKNSLIGISLLCNICDVPNTQKIVLFGTNLPFRLHQGTHDEFFSGNSDQWPLSYWVVVHPMAAQTFPRLVRLVLLSNSVIIVLSTLSQYSTVNLTICPSVTDLIGYSITPSLKFQDGGQNKLNECQANENKTDKSRF